MSQKMLDGQTDGQRDGQSENYRAPTISDAGALIMFLLMLRSVLDCKYKQKKHVCDLLSQSVQLINISLEEYVTQ